MYYATPRPGVGAGGEGDGTAHDETAEAQAVTMRWLDEPKPN